jgi:hypothetical protein
MGWANGRYDPSANGVAARADVMASLLNEVLAKRQGWLPELRDTEDAMRAWEASTPRENVLRLYKFLNELGYTVIGIDAAIEREKKGNNKPDKGIPDLTKKTRP